MQNNYTLYFYGIRALGSNHNLKEVDPAYVRIMFIPQPLLQRHQTES